MTDDGTIVYRCSNRRALDGFLDGLDGDDYEICEGRVETAWWVLADHAALVPGRKYVVERYPNGGMVVEVTPL